MTLILHITVHKKMSSDQLHFVILQSIQFIAWIYDIWQNKKSMVQIKYLEKRL
jgi:hypothetical protein